MTPSVSKQAELQKSEKRVEFKAACKSLARAGLGSTARAAVTAMRPRGGPQTAFTPASARVP
jgi:hypothetical protein